MEGGSWGTHEAPSLAVYSPNHGLLVGMPDLESLKTTMYRLSVKAPTQTGKRQGFNLGAHHGNL